CLCHAVNANSSAYATATAPASAIVVFCQSARQPTNSINNNRTPPARCAASASTRSGSTSLTAGWRVHSRNQSSAAGRVSACDSVKKCSGRNSARTMPETRCTTNAQNAGWARARASLRRIADDIEDGVAISDSQRTHGVKAAAQQHECNQRQHGVGCAPAEPKPFVGDRAQPERRVNRDCDNEDRVEGRPPYARVHPGNDGFGGELMAHSVDDRREMHDDTKGKHGRGRALQHESPCCVTNATRRHGVDRRGNHSVPLTAAVATSRLRLAIEAVGDRCFG